MIMQYIDDNRVLDDLFNFHIPYYTFFRTPITSLTSTRMIKKLKKTSRRRSSTPRFLITLFTLSILISQSLCLSGFYLLSPVILTCDNAIQFIYITNNSIYINKRESPSVCVSVRILPPLSCL